MKKGIFSLVMIVCLLFLFPDITVAETLWNESHEINEIHIEYGFPFYGTNSNATIEIYFECNIAVDILITNEYEQYEPEYTVYFSEESVIQSHHILDLGAGQFYFRVRNSDSIADGYFTAVINNINGMKKGVIGETESPTDENPLAWKSALYALAGVLSLIGAILIARRIGKGSRMP